MALPHLAAFNAETVAGLVTFGIIIWCKSKQSGIASRFFSSRLLTFAGAISYSLYLVHPLVGNRILRFVGKRLDDHGSFLIQLGCFTAVIALATFASWILYRLIELPSQNLSRRIYKKLVG